MIWHFDMFMFLISIPAGEKCIPKYFMFTKSLKTVDIILQVYLSL